MKKIQIILAATALLLAACSPGGDSDQMPTDLAGLREAKKQKELAINTLNKEIAEIDKAIAKLDTSANGHKKRLVTTAPVTVKDFHHYVSVQGSVQPAEAVFASSLVGGKIIYRPVKEGQMVREGQLIARLDTEAMEKQKEELLTSLSLARDVYQRQKRLWEQQIGSEIQYLQAKNNVERLEKSVESMDATLKNTNVYSPISGVVNKVFFDAGETTGPGAPVAEIIRTTTAKVVVDVPENYLGNINKGDKVMVSFPALGIEKEAPVSLIGGTIDPTNRTFSVEVALSNSDGTLKPNLLAEIKFEDYIKEEAVVVPIELVQQEVTGQNFIMIVGEQNGHSAAEKSYVEIGKSYQGEIVIESGLEKGETLIIDGARTVSEGDILEIQQSANNNG